MFGDVNNDGTVDIGDAAYIASYIVGLTGFSIESTNIADVNKDGTVDIGDAAYIASYVVGLPGFEIENSNNVFGSITEPNPEPLYAEIHLLINDSEFYESVSDFKFIKANDKIGVYVNNVLSYEFTPSLVTVNEQSYYKFKANIQLSESTTKNITFKYLNSSTNVVHTIENVDSTDLTSVNALDIFGLSGPTKEIKFKIV